MLHEVPLCVVASRPDSPYVGGARCDLCSKRITGDDPFFHCDICSFDLCEGCMGNLSERISICGGCGNKTVIRMTADDFLSENKEQPGRLCSKCQKMKGDSFFMVCTSCKYGICANCYYVQVVCINHSFCTVTFFFFPLHHLCFLIV